MTQAPAPARQRRGKGPAARLFPGDRRIWLAAAAVIGAGAIVVLIALLLPRDYYTGTNSVRTRSFPVELQARDKLCAPVSVPADTGQVQIQTDTGGGARPALTGTVTDSSGKRLGRGTAPRGGPGIEKVAFPVAVEEAASGATLCIQSAGKVFLGGVGALQGDDQPLKLNGKENANRIAVWYLPPAGEKRSLLSHPGEILDRAALLRPAWVGPWTYWLTLLVAMPLLGYAAVRLLATAPGRSARNAAVAVALVATANGWAWALVSTPFNVPDESEHYAYVQYLAETGNQTQGQTAPPPLLPVYSTDETFALDAVRILSWNEVPDGRPPWTPAAEEGWRERQAREGDVPRDNGGGPTPATWAHQPAYYALLAPAYLAASGGSTFDQLTAARFLSALYVAIAAACAFLLVRELLPRQPVLAVAAGLLVAFHPMFGMIGGAVSNDSGVNAAAAVVILLTVRALRRGLTVRSGVALGAAVALLPIMKATGYSLYPLVALAGLGMLIRRHGRRDLIAYGATLAALVLVAVGWRALSGVWEQPASAPGGGGGGGAGAGTTADLAAGDPLGYLSYLWQVFLPPLPFMSDLFIYRWPFFNIYIERGWGAFGWYSALFPAWVYTAIVIVTGAVGALGVRAAVRGREWLTRHWMEVGFVVLVPVTVIAAVEAAYFAPTPRNVLPEFGRYLFPAMTALAAITVGSCLGLGRRWAPIGATVLVGAVFVLDYASQLLTLSSFYS